MWDQATDTLTPQRLTRLDFGNLGWTAAGLADDGRVLLTGWVPAGSDPSAVAAGCPSVKGIAVCGVQAEGVVRVVSYDAAAQTVNQPLAYPPFPPSLPPSSLFA